ncbi:MAG: anthranilate synthase component I family protein [Acidimicrobiales bacterium]|nr:anthranilate synthase component I family protein [Acidimicrobiales bacterium]
MSAHVPATTVGVGPGAVAVVDGVVATGLVDVTDDPAALDGAGWWAVVVPFEGPAVLARFADRRPLRPSDLRPDRWRGPDPASWRSSIEEADFTAAVNAIRGAIGRGDVYQVNLTRRLRAPLPPGASMFDLGSALAARHPARHGAVVELPSHGIRLASASPELFLDRVGDRVRSSPIKGTAASADAFLAKDVAENVMIVDLVRNDLGRVCRPGTVHVPELLGTEAHPGLVHMVSTVEGRLRPDVGWPELLAATFPPGSVTGAPKLAALDHIARLEPCPRGVYCGAVGWVDADRRRGRLNVAIRTFFVDGDDLCFGTGGGITWDSTARGEWAETELKARRLLEVASSPIGAPA